MKHQNSHSTLFARAADGRWSESLAPSGRGLLVITALLIAVLGPYIGDGLRTEQTAVYATAAVLLPFTFFALRPSRSLSHLLVVWGVYAAVASAGSLQAASNDTPWPSGPITAGLDNVVLPIAVMLIILSLSVFGASTDRMLQRTAQVVIAGMIVNAVAATAQFYGSDWSQWWGNGGNAVAVGAETNGRFSGLLNQPAEAGTLYGLALLCALFLLSSRPLLLSFVVTFLVLGGVLTVSKIFLLVALPIACWQMLRTQHGRTARLVIAGATVAGLWTVVRAGILPQWTGVDQIRRITPTGNGSVLDSLTAGRFGTTSTLRPVAEAVLAEHPVFGFGVGGLEVAYDNGWLEALVTAGLTGAVCYSAALVIMASIWRKMAVGLARNLFGATVLLVAVGSLGFPVLTGNRVATVAWTLVTLCAMGSERHDGPISSDLVEGLHRKPVEPSWRRTLPETAERMG